MRCQATPTFERSTSHIFSVIRELLMKQDEFSCKYSKGKSSYFGKRNIVLTAYDISNNGIRLILLQSIRHSMLKMHELMSILVAAHINFAYQVRWFDRKSSAYYNGQIFFFVQYKKSCTTREKHYFYLCGYYPRFSRASNFTLAIVYYVPRRTMRVIARRALSRVS